MNREPFELRRFAPHDAAILFICDHASNRMPTEYGNLGLDAHAMASHIAYDIGAGEVATRLAEAYGATAVLARWSRLLIDLNRGPDDPTLVMKLSDGRIVPGNRHIDAAEQARRLQRYYAPYHAAIRAEIAQARAAGHVPVIVSVHSFTPSWKGRPRPWEVGVLWDRDSRLASPLITALARDGLVVGDNEPYSGELENDCLFMHATMNGLPHVLIEIRQDLIATPDCAWRFAARLKPLLDEALAAMPPAHIRFTRPLMATEGDHIVDEKTRTEIEAAVFRRLVAHLRERTDVQNIELMIAGGFCRNCLGDWYRDAAAEKGIALEKDAAREIVYGMPQADWKRLHQKEATPEQQAAFARTQKTHS